MAQALQDWIEAEVRPVRERPVSWLSQQHFFRDPIRPIYSDARYFFSPADGIILYQREVDPDEPLVEVKGRPYSLSEALRDPEFDQRCLVIGIFMTFYDVHVNRVPYPGRLSFRSVDPIDTLNHPMLDVEKSILEDLRVSTRSAEYLHHNQRMVNRFDSLELGQAYYVLQIADYDVNSITPFELKQNEPRDQGHRFSQIRYGSQVDLIVPLTGRWDFVPLLSEQVHVQAGVDPIIEVRAPRTNFANARSQ